MTYQAYLDTIKAKTGKTPDDFKALARQKGLLEPGVKVGQIVAWLKQDFGLGQGHAMAIVLALKQDSAPKLSRAERGDKIFSRDRARWRDTYDQLMKKLGKFGADVRTSPTDTYISLLKGNKKFAIVAATADRLDIGIKLKGVAPGGRLEPAGAWNSMVTHRVRITDPKQVDGEVLAWLKRAYAAA